MMHDHMGNGSGTTNRNGIYDATEQGVEHMSAASTRQKNGRTDRSAHEKQSSMSSVPRVQTCPQLICIVEEFLFEENDVDIVS